MPNLFQLLQPMAPSQTPALPAYLLLCVSESDEAQPARATLSLVSLCDTDPRRTFGLSHLPDDPEVLPIISLSHSSEHTPIFIHVPKSGCYLLPVSLDTDEALLSGQQSCRFGPKSVGVLNISDGGSLMLGDDTSEEGMEEEVAVKTTAWTGVCTVLLVAFILIFLLGIVLHNMSCVSKRFTIISCG